MFIWEQNTEEHLENVTYAVFAFACRVTQSATQRKKQKQKQNWRKLNYAQLRLIFLTLTNWQVETPFFQFLTT